MFYTDLKYGLSVREDHRLRVSGNKVLKEILWLKKQEKEA
jgi:hypothetical protein